MERKDTFGIYLLFLVVLFGTVFFSAAAAGGILIGPNVQVTDAGLDGKRATTPHIVAQGSTLYAVWKDERANAFDAEMIYFAKSTDAGKTWGPNVRVSQLPYDDWTNTPQIGVQPDGTIWIVWHSLYKDDSDKINDLRLARSSDDGATFTVETLLDGYDDSGDRYRPRLTVDESSGRVYILTHEYRRLEEDEGYYIDVLVFDAAGNPVAVETVSDEPRTGRGTYANIGVGNTPLMDIAARDGLICAAWEDRRGRFAIYGTCSSDGGATWSANFDISGPDSVFPRIDIAPDGTLYTAYALNSDAQRHIQLRRSTDRGKTWSAPRPVTAQYEVEEVRDWDLAIDNNGQIAVAWMDEDFSSSDLFLSTSVDVGQYFARTHIEDMQGDFPAGAEQYGVSLATGGSGNETTAWLIWQDDRNDGQQIWSQSVLLDGIAPTAPTSLSAESDDTSNLLRWEASTDAAGIRGYQIFRAPAAEGPYERINPLLAPTTSYRDVGLDTTTYFYEVAAVDGTDNVGMRSEQASAAAKNKSDLTVNGTIAYERGDDIQLRSLPALDNLRTPAQGAAPRFSADGSRIIYYTSNTLSSRNVDGSDSQILLQNEKMTSSFDVSNDGSQIGILYSRQFAAPGTPAGSCFVTEPNYFANTQLRYTDEHELATDVAISATGSWLVYRSLGFCSVAAFGNYEPPHLCVVKTETNEKSCSQLADISAPDFAPSGERIVFAADFTGQAEIWTAKMQQNGALANYAQITSGPTNQPASEPAWSSDGNWVIFQRDIDAGEGEDQRLFIVRADGNSLRTLNIAGKNAAWHGGGQGGMPPGGSGQNERVYLPHVEK